IIAKELLTQLGLYRGNFFEKESSAEIKIPIVFNYAPFALKYNRFRYRFHQKHPGVIKENHAELSNSANL
ncbi:MAG: hypothetical protein OXB84_03745, partial [Halobacteriovoraceae bacterium]|nr:hypothetical protein [Halobacteriovoraceae bacterium]